MKTTINKTAAKPEYPCLMRLKDKAHRARLDTNELIVLFSSEKEGVVIEGFPVYKPGYAAMWAASEFEIFSGTITLEQ